MMDRSRDLVLVLSTVPDRETGLRIARALVADHLVACVNIVPGLTSVYRWEAEIRADDEQLLLMKTPRSRLDALTERLPKLHPYDVPELLAIPIEAGLPTYCEWVVAETMGATS